MWSGWYWFDALQAQVSNIQDSTLCMSKRKRDVYCPFVYNGRLPLPKWPPLSESDAWTDQDIAEAEMVNSLHLEPSRHQSKYQSKFRRKEPARHRSQLITALDLANFDDSNASILELRNFTRRTKHAWKPLPLMVQLWCELSRLELWEWPTWDCLYPVPDGKHFVIDRTIYKEVDPTRQSTSKGRFQFKWGGRPKDITTKHIMQSR